MTVWVKKTSKLNMLLGVLFLALVPNLAAAYVVGGPGAAFQVSSQGWAWEGGAFVTEFRTALEDPIYFGPGGVVEETIVTVDITPNAAGLAGVDGFIAPWWRRDESAPFDADVVNFFLGGGDLWLLQDSGPNQPGTGSVLGRDGIGDLLGIPTVGQTAITPVNGIAPLFDGPFGIANNVGQGGGEEGFLSTADVLAANGTIIGTNTENQVIAAAWGANQFAPGAGALIIVADIDMFTTQASFYPLDDNGIFTLNAFAFLSGSEEPIPTVPVPPTGLLLLLGLGLTGIVNKRRTR